MVYKTEISKMFLWFVELLSNRQKYFSVSSVIQIAIYLTESATNQILEIFLSNQYSKDPNFTLKSNDGVKNTFFGQD